MGGASVQQMADRIAMLMGDRLGVRGRTLADKLRRGGRLLPRRVRRQAEYLCRAVEEAAHPVLRARADQSRTVAAFDDCLRYLRPIGARGRWANRLMDFAARVAFAVFATSLMVLAVLLWRGFL